MYSASRHLVTLQVGNNLRHACLESGVKSLRQNAIQHGRQFSLCSRVNLRNTSAVPLKSFIGIPRVTSNSQYLNHLTPTCNQCRCYSKSIGKEAVANEETTNSEDVQDKDIRQGESSESSSVEAENEEMDMYDEEDRGAYLTDEQIQMLSNGDPEIVKKIKYLQLEFSVMRQDGEQVPSHIKLKSWRELLPLTSKSRRRKFYLYLFKTEMKELSFQRKKEFKREERLKSYAENPMPSKEEDIYGMFYGLARNTIFLRLYDATITKTQHCRVASAMLHHPPLVIDCSYDEYMTHREAKNCAKQIELLISENRAHQEPFNLYLCNAAKTTKTVEFLQRIIPTIEDDGFPINFHEGSYMDLFPQKRLVYLTPHTRDELEEYNEDDIYIIGAMVDKSDPRPYSLAKAKKLNITMKRLPLDQHLMWGLGGKALTINQMVRIMLDLRYTRGDWKAALKHVPMRKLCRDYHPYPDQEQNQNESENRSPMMSSRKERKSFVMEDYELLNRRKGYQRSHSFPSNNRGRSNQSVIAPKVKSLFYDDN